MPINIEDVKPLTQAQTWKQQYQGIEATDEKLKELNNTFADYVQQVYDLGEYQRDEFEDYLTDLGKVSDHWKEVNDWITENITSLGSYGNSLSSIRDLFSDISRITGGLRRQLTENLSVVRKVNNLASDAVFITKTEEGLTTKVARNQALQAQKLEYLYTLKLKAFEPNLDENQSLVEQLPLLDRLREKHERLENTIQKRINFLTREITSNARLEYGSRQKYRQELKALEEEKALHQSIVEMAEKAAAESVSSLRKQLELRAEMKRSEMGYTHKLPEEALKELPKEVIENERLRNHASPFNISLAEQTLKRFNLGEVAENLHREFEQFSNKRILAAEDYLQTKSTVKAELPEAEKSRDRAEAIRDRALKTVADITERLNKVVSEKESISPARRANGTTIGEVKAAVAREKRVAELVEKEKQLNDKLKEANKLAKEFGDKYELANSRVTILNSSLSASQKSLEKATEESFNLGKILSIVRDGAINKITKGLDGWPGKLAAALAIAGFIWKQLVAVTSEADKLKQHIGTWSISASAANFAFASSVQWLQAGVELAEKFKINPVQLFSPNEIGRMAEVKNLLGLTSDQAANLTVRTKMAGTNMDQYRVALTKGINAGNEAFRTAIGLGDATRAALNASDAITLSMGNNAEKIGKAAVAAASLGMELKDVEGISQNLINFESSIQAEMQAQLLTGKQLNLAKAREYALNNDLAGVAQELTRQGITAADWGKMNVIQQENVAKALGMSRDQMAKMLVTQYLSGQLSKQALMDATHMTAEQIEALGVQERMKIAVQKLAQSFVPILEILVPIVELVSNLVTGIAGVIGSLTGLSFTANKAGVKKKDKVYTDVSSYIGSSRFKGKLTPEKAERELQRELRKRDLTKEQKEALEKQLGDLRSIQASDLSREQKNERIADLMGVQTASAGSFSKTMMAAIPMMFLMPKAVSGTVTGMGKLVGSIGRLGQGFKSVFTADYWKGLGTKFKNAASVAKNGPKAVAGSGAASAAGKTAQTVKGTGSNLPKLGSAIRRFLQNFDNRVTGGMLAKATGAGLVFVLLLPTVPAIAAMSAIGPFASKGLPLAGTGIAGFFKTIGKVNPKDIGIAALASLLVAGSVAAFGLALRTFKDIEWNTVFKGIVSLAAFTAAMIGIGALMSSGGIVLVAGAALAMAMLAGAVALVGLSLKTIQDIKWETIGKLPVALLALTAAGALALIAGPSLLVGSLTLLPAAVALGTASLALALASIPLKFAVNNLNSLGELNLTGLLDSVAELQNFKSPSIVEAGKFALFSVVFRKGIRKLQNLEVGVVNLSQFINFRSPSVTEAQQFLQFATDLRKGVRKLNFTSIKTPDFSKLERIGGFGTGISATASALTQVATALASVSSHLDRVDTRKLRSITRSSALSQVVSRFTKRNSVEIPNQVEIKEESKGKQKENISSNAEELVTKQAKLQASTQQISIEQKTADLNRIESKMDAVIKAIKDSAPTDWDWVRFGQEMGRSVPFANR